MTLLEEIREYTAEILELRKEFGGRVYPDTNEALLRCNAILTPLEIMIRKFELRLKRDKIQLKESEEYAVFKTIKAKDEQVVLDTYDISEAILDLKLIRNKLRYKREYYEYQIRQRLSEVD